MFKNIRIPKLNMALKLLIIIALVFLAGDHVPYSIKSGLYGLSMTIKQILLFVLPIVIFSCLFSTLLSFKDRALKFMLLLFLAVFVSNTLSLYYAYGVGHFGLSFLKLSFEKVDCSANQLMPLWDWGIKPIIPNELALLAGALLGFLFAVVQKPKVNHLADTLSNFVSIFLNKVFIPVLPLFALGFLLKMQYDGVLVTIFKTYGPILLLLIAALVLYLLVIFFIGSGFRVGRTIAFVKNAIPAGITGFSTMSSMAAMPVNIAGAEKNTNDPTTVRAVIPAATNIHMIGDSVIVPVISMAVMMTFGKELPDFVQYSVFLGFFLFAKLAVAGVPGAGILVAIPLLEKYFGFDSEMSALVYTIYVLFDPIDTAGNVLGNNGFSIIMSDILNRGKSKAEPVSL